jgi:hypothetical protein
MPLRHLMKLHADFAAEASGLVAKLDGALAFAEQVIASGALFFRGNPAVAERLKAFSSLDRRYLAHEFFNQDWRVTPFSEVARWLEQAKLSFVASAHLLDHVDAVNLSEAGQKLLAGISHPILRQSVRDYFVNQQFRRDIFAKGYRRLTPLEQNEALRQQAFVLLVNEENVQLKVSGPLGEATLHEPVYRPVVQALADNGYAPKTLGQLAAHAHLSTMPFPQITQAILVLTGAGYVHPAQEPSRQARARCAAMNRYICERTRSSAEVFFLASPISASGIPVPMFEQMFLLAAQHGRKTPKDQAAYAWDLLSAQGRHVMKEGKSLTSPEENLDELLRQATTFAEKRLPVLKGLGIS